MALRLYLAFSALAVLVPIGSAAIHAAEAPGRDIGPKVQISPVSKNFGRSPRATAKLKIKNRTRGTLFGPFTVAVKLNRGVRLEGASQDRNLRWVLPLTSSDFKLGPRKTLISPPLRFSNPQRYKFNASFKLYGLLAPNRPPVADAGGARSVLVGDSVVLDGSRSVDPDGSLSQYRWQLQMPAGSGAYLFNTEGIGSGFTADVPGTYNVQLIVNDGIDDSVPASVAVTASSSPPPPPPPQPPPSSPPPVPTIDSLIDNTGNRNDWTTSYWSPTVGGSVAPGAAQVQVLTTATPGQEYPPPPAPAPATVPVGNDGRWSYTYPELADGSYDIRVLGIAGDGRVSAASAVTTLTIDSRPQGNVTAGSQGIVEDEIPFPIYKDDKYGGPLLRVKPPSADETIAEVEVQIRPQSFLIGPGSSLPDVELSEVSQAPILFSGSDLLPFSADKCGTFTDDYPDVCTDINGQPLDGQFYGLNVNKFIAPGIYELSLRVKYSSGLRSRLPFSPDTILTIIPNGDSLVVQDVDGTFFANEQVPETTNKTPVITGQYGPTDEQRLSVSLYNLDAAGGRHEIGTFSSSNNPLNELVFFARTAWQLHPNNPLAAGTYLVEAKYRYDNARATTTETFIVVP